jgi:hypothetical protein
MYQTKLKMKKLFFTLSFCAAALVSKSQNGLENIIVEKYYVSDAADAAGSSGVLPIGSVTYRVFVDMLPGYNFQALYGVNGTNPHVMNISTTTSFFNDEDYGGTTPTISGNNVRKGSALIDSYFSVGGGANGKIAVLKTDDTDGSPGNAQGILQNNDASAGDPINIGTSANLAAKDGLIAGAPVAVTFVGLTNTGNGDLGVFDGTSQVGNLFTTDNGSVAALGGATGADPATNIVLVGQFTTDGIFCFELNIQIGTPTGGVENYVSFNPVANEILFAPLIYCSNTGVDEINKSTSTVKVTPNPAQNFINIEIVNKQQGYSATLTLSDVTGKVITTKNIALHSGNHIESLDISNLSNGYYMLNVKTKDKSVFSKIVKQ